MADSTDLPETRTDQQLHEALASVERALEQVDGCTDEEKTALAADVRSLRDMLAKLEQGKVHIAVFGEISTGKERAHQCFGWPRRCCGEHSRRVDQGCVASALGCRRLPRAGVRRLRRGAARHARAQRSRRSQTD